MNEIEEGEADFESHRENRNVDFETSRPVLTTQNADPEPIVKEKLTSDMVNQVFEVADAEQLQEVVTESHSNFGFVCKVATLCFVIIILVGAIAATMFFDLPFE